MKKKKVSKQSPPFMLGHNVQPSLAPWVPHQLFVLNPFYFIFKHRSHLILDWESLEEKLLAFIHYF